MRLLRWLIRPHFAPDSRGARIFQGFAFCAGLVAFLMAIHVWAVILSSWLCAPHISDLLPFPRSNRYAWCCAVYLGIGTGLAIAAIRFGSPRTKWRGKYALVSFGIMLAWLYLAGLSYGESIIEYWSEWWRRL